MSQLFNTGTSQMNMVETKDEIVATCYLPGLDPNDIKVKVDNNLLIISGETRREQQQSYGSFQQSISLPDHVSLNSLKKEYDNGILKVRIRKKP